MKEKNESKTLRGNIDPALVAKAKAGDQAAFSELYSQTCTGLYRSVCAMVHDEDLAWDIIQDSYLKAFQSLDKLEADGAFLSWLRRIAVNETARQTAKRLPLTFTELSGDGDDEFRPELPELDPDAQPELALDRKESARLVREILAELPEQQRLIVGMRYFEELDTNEIASLLHLAPSTVRVQLHAGRKKVETKVRALEQQGVKLYGLSPMPFLLALLRRIEPAEAAERKLLSTILSQTPAAGSAAAAGAADAAALTATPVTVSSFGHVLAGRLVAGVLAVALIGGGIFAGVKLLKSNNTDEPYQPTTSATSERLAETETEPTEPTVRPTQTPAHEDSDQNLWLPEDTDPEPEETGEFVPDPSWPTGSCGENLTWYFDAKRGRLTIAGSGAMNDYPHWWTDEDNYASFPWYSKLSEIKSVRLLDGVTHVGDGAFAECIALTRVSIPDSVTSIGDSAFADCNRLTSLTIPDSVTGIGDSAFQWCKALSDVTIGSGVTSIGNWAFSYCDSLTELAIPDSVTSIDDGAFLGCERLTRVTIPDSVTSIGDYVFKYCAALESIEVASGNPSYSSRDGVLFDKAQTELLAYPAGKKDASYAIPEGVTRIDMYAFISRSNLKEIMLPSTLTDVVWIYLCAEKIRISPENPSYSSVDGVVFDKTQTKLLFYPMKLSVGVYQIPDGVTEIGAEAFLDQDRMTGVIIPDSVTAIGVRAFSGCSNLKDVTIGSGVTRIGEKAFLGCTQLETVTIPDSVREIGDYAFGYEEKSQDYFQYGKFVIYGAAGSAAEDYATRNEFRFARVEADGSCGDQLTWSFDRDSGLLTIEGSGAMTEYDNMYLLAPWYDYKTEIKTISLPEGLTSLTDYAFANCTALTHVEIPGSVTRIGECCFIACTALTSVTIEDGVEEIGMSAFWRCSALTELNLPDSLRRIGEIAFEDCRLLKAVKLPSGVEEIGEKAFGWLDDGSRKRTEFTVYGTPGTAAEDYAKQNSFTFVAE